MEKAILIKMGELFLKGLNRPMFEKALTKSIKQKLKKFGEFQIHSGESIIYLVFKNKEICFENICEKVKKIFGISIFSIALIAKKNIEDIFRICNETLKEDLSLVNTFKIETRRSDKKFFIKSPEISKIVGAKILEKYKNLSVNLFNPELIINIEIRKNFAFIYTKIYEGAKGMPANTASSAVALISGGIDSPVAAWMMAKRGTLVNAIHFASPPYTSVKTEEKVERLIKKICEYSENIKLFIVKFTKIQEQIKEECESEYATIIGRRIMIKIAEKLCKNLKSKALITGESLAQVASQTMDSLICTNSAASLPILRPLIGMDKNEIVEIAKKIGTFDTSIEPFEDCCTIFTPKHPNVKPTLDNILKNESKFNIEDLIKEAIQKIRIVNFMEY